MRRLRELQLPSPAMAVAVLALIVALSGTSYAVSRLPAKSVGTRELKNGAVVSEKVKTGSLKRNDFKRGEIPRGPRGRPGATSVTVRAQPGGKIDPGKTDAQTANCPAGERAVGGGASFASDPEANDSVLQSRPSIGGGQDIGSGKTPDGWRSSMRNGGTQPRAVVAYVVCAKP